MPRMIERLVYIGVAGLICVTPTECQEHRQRASAPSSASPKHELRPPPAAQYSPLAAQGGYRGQGMTWYEALFKSLNPQNIDWGAAWEGRRRIFLQNSVGNRYFVYTAVLSLLLLYSGTIVVWQRWNHRERLRALAQTTADTTNYARYWKQKATETIRKHNDHIEQCNRVIEAGDGGMPIGDAAEVHDLRRELERMRTEVLNLTSENKRLRSDLEQKSVMVADLSARVDEATRRIGANNGPGTKGGENATQVAALVDRINRLEAALTAARRENERLKGA